jgi:hypothetical protein
MGFLTRKKDLERARVENERLERELVEVRRHEEERNRDAAVRENARNAEERRKQELEDQANQLAMYKRRRKQELEDQAIQRAKDERRRKQELEDQAIQRAKDKRNAKIKKMKESSPETLRDLRELIRNRYQMDVEIWGLRTARKADRPKVLEKMVVADAIMEEIWMTVGTWENQQDGNWTDEEWVRVQEIKARLQSDGKRVWEGNPPWADAGIAGRGRVGAGRANRW